MTTMRAQEPLVVGGDINITLNEEENMGGLLVTQQEIIDFAQCLNNCYSRVIWHSWRKYTWWT